MSKPKILIQFDTDAHSSVFDSVVAVDSGVDQLLTHAGINADNVEPLVHGAMFTRGPEDLKSTAIFVGGSNVELAEQVVERVQKCFFGPLRVATMLDANGANTTAAAAVLAASRHIDLSTSECTVLAATGPVGKRIVRLLARKGCRVRVVSRNQERAESACERIAAEVDGAQLTPIGASNGSDIAATVEGVNGLFAAGAAGVELVDEATWSSASQLAVAVDLNAVPPAGIGGIEIGDRKQLRHETICYGPIGVGGTKMKIHKAAIQRLFTDNSLTLDAEAIYEIGEQLTN